MTRYRPVRMHHPAAGYTYGILAEVSSEDGETAWKCVAVAPDISCDWLFVQRLAIKWTAEQLEVSRLAMAVAEYVML